MHKNIGLLYSEPLDSYWSRVYDLLAIRDSSLFPMTTVAGDEVIRPYINAGLLVLNPECGLLQKWPGYFEKLYKDSAIRELCKQDSKRNIFLFQVSLTANILNNIKREKMAELSDRYNYPIFFDVMFGAVRPFDSIEKAISIRHEGFFAKPFLDWDKKLKGSPQKIAWLKTHMCPDE
jgi:hypothetical protein